MDFINNRVERLVQDAIRDMHGATAYELDKRLTRYRRDVIDGVVKQLTSRGVIMAAETTADPERTGGEREPVEVYVNVEFEGVA